jgi:hypothetical protein
MAYPNSWWMGMLQYGIRALVSNTEPGWAEKVELIHLHGIGQNPQFLLLNSWKI